MGGFCRGNPVKFIPLSYLKNILSTVDNLVKSTLQGRFSAEVQATETHLQVRATGTFRIFLTCVNPM